MLPGAGRAAAAGGSLIQVRAAARTSFFIGLALAAMALVVATSYPTNFHFHAQSQIGHAAAPAAYGGQPQAQQRCAATEAEALDLRATALALVLSGVAQAMFAAAADVALAETGFDRFLGRWFTAVALLVGATNVWCICYVVHGVAVVAAGHCAGGYLPDLGSYFLVAVSSAVMLCVSLAFTHFG